MPKLFPKVISRLLHHLAEDLRVLKAYYYSAS